MSKEYRIILKGAEDEYVDGDGWNIDPGTGTIAVYVNKKNDEGSKFVAVFNLQSVIGVVEI